MAHLEIRKSNDFIERTWSCPITNQDTDTFRYEEQDGMIGGGTWDGETYTPPTPPVDPEWLTAFNSARDELFGDDPKDIATGTDAWMKCVRYGALERMDADCKTAIVAAYE